jgi:CRISPR-associated endonuclease/helicase Cas3
MNCSEDRYLAWGKLSFEIATNGEPAIHPLYDHMLDVAMCFIAIVTASARLRSALNRTAGRSLSEQDIERLAVLVLLHDIGKANSGFQAKRWKERAPKGWPRQAGHGREALGVLDEQALNATLPLQAMNAWGESAYRLLLASLAHHGRPINTTETFDSYLWRPVSDEDGVKVYDPATALSLIGNRLKQDFPLAFEPGSESLPSTPAFAHMFAGVVQFADWLGSNKARFEFSEPGTERTRSDAETLAKEAVAAIDLDACARRAQLDNHSITFERLFEGNSPRPMQSKLGEGDLGPLLILESETGSGKTEAALWRFVKLFREGKVDSLYFALPTRVAAVQVYERVRKFVSAMWVDDAPITLRALAGYESVDGNELTRLPGFETLWSDNPNDTKAATRWAAESSKRFLAAPIAVGTIDQALLAGLQVRHAHLRHALLSRSLLVVDEVHASDTYMSQLLEGVLRAHLATGGHALLLSATLGTRQRTRFMRIAQGLNPNAPLPPIEEARHACYPAISDGAHVHALEPSGEPKQIRWRTLDAIDNFKSVAEIAVQAAKQGARVLIVRNTVPSAIATQEALERLVDQSGERAWLFDVNGIATLHHSRFSRQDRPLLDKRVEERVGKHRTGLQACIVVGTQTLEQSLDIDADLLITDICPMDVLLQRLGRLHRHKREQKARPDKFQEAFAWVLTPAGGDLEPYLQKPRNGLGLFKNGGGVYTDLRMIEATRRLIDESEQRVIPRDNRELVERATHPECLSAIHELGPEWAKLGQRLEGSDGAERTFARYNALDFRTPFEELAFIKGDQSVATRLGAADRLITFDRPLSGPFGFDVKQIALRHHMVPEGVSADARATQIELDKEGFSFSLGAARFRYDRFGIKKA